MPSKEELKQELFKLLREKQEYQDTNKALFYKPYKKQVEFHKAGKSFRERLFMAGNQLGKTLAGAMEWGFHLTGDYPDWWPGKRFIAPVRLWAAGVSNESTRDNPQRLLLGQIGQHGTGAIPKGKIDDIRMARGINDAVDTVLVRHKRGTSQLSFKSYEKGREKWQGETLHGIWFDEEPPIAVYTEGLTRTNATRGIVMITFTPMLGMSNVVARFKQPPAGDPKRSITIMTIDDVEHYTKEEKEQVIADYLPHEREARAYGEPMLGSGRVYPIAEAVLKEQAIEIPDHWARIVGLDVGWDHPTAAVWVAHDRDDDVIHVYDCYRQSEQTPIIHAAAVKARGPWIPVAWPHDAIQHDKGSGEQIAQLYRDQGLKMLHERAQYADERGNGVEAGVIDIMQRMQTGRLKVAEHLLEWFEEYRGYHRKEGRIVKERDDLMDALRYAVMMLRYAKPKYFTEEHEERYQLRNFHGGTSWLSR